MNHIQNLKIEKNKNDISWILVRDKKQRRTEMKHRQKKIQSANPLDLACFLTNYIVGRHILNVHFFQLFQG